MPQIKPSTSTQFPVGSKVKITDNGQVCSTYHDMARHMRLEEKGFDWAKGRNVLENGDIGVVVAKAMHESEYYGEVLAVEVGDQVTLILSKGVVEEVATVSLKDLKEGQRVKLIGDNGGHRHWKFVIGEEYDVINKRGTVGPVSPQLASGEVPSTDWGQWKWQIVKEAPVIGKPKLSNQEQAPLTPRATELFQYFKDAPK